MSKEGFPNREGDNLGINLRDCFIGDLEAGLVRPIPPEEHSEPNLYSATVAGPQGSELPFKFRTTNGEIYCEGYNSVRTWLVGPETDALTSALANAGHAKYIRKS